VPELLGVDNVMLAVRDLDAAVGFYEACGFTMKFRLDQAGMALFGIATGQLETMTGITVEATDPSGNVVGFADYSKRPEMARA
jgi:catechol 2,3-dioxygenase-like lactoylglutathione lyase family enzyme